MWNIVRLQSLPRSVSEFAPVLMKILFARAVTCAIDSAEADEISPRIRARSLRSTSRSALVVAVCGLTESSLIT
ncbi:hypothetical protein D9M70_629450 [compost metagenome]